MLDVLTERQKDILLAIINEYTTNAQEVGSAQIIRKYKFKVSSATIRNEMVKLMDLGFLEKSHVSSGRAPTDMAFRMYVNEQVDRELNDSVRMVQIKQGIFSVRFYPEKMIRAILQILVDNSNAASFVMLDDMIRHFGVSTLMSNEELQNVSVIQRILDLLEDENLLKSAFEKGTGEEVTVLIGRELGIKNLETCALAFIKFKFWEGREGYMGVVGSRRLDYKNMIPTLISVKQSVEDSLKGWN